MPLGFCPDVQNQAERFRVVEVEVLAGFAVFEDKQDRLVVRCFSGSVTPETRSRRTVMTMGP